jgi:hypothetical protein
MHGLKYIEPRLRTNADIRIRSFYYTDTLSISASSDIRKDASHIGDDCVLFYFIHDDIILETIRVAIANLIEYEEVWVKRHCSIEEASLYATNTFEKYSYVLLHPFQ